MPILQILGGDALSSFRLQQLLDQLRGILPDLKSISARYCYIASYSQSLDQSAIQVLLDLLEVDSICEGNPLTDDADFLIFPRLGTRTPWSSKAIDILHCCGAACIERIERGKLWSISSRAGAKLTKDEVDDIVGLMHDRMTETVIADAGLISQVFNVPERESLESVDLQEIGLGALNDANARFGLALTESELSYVANWYRTQMRNPTDAELMMFSQVNSEHCRHKIFNANWVIDGKLTDESLFSMIRKTHRANPDGTLVAYEDNASVIEGCDSMLFFPDPHSRKYRFGVAEPSHVIYKAETHNHPTAISPFPGAATGAGGEIRDEGATGRGGRPKAGLCGFSVSHLRIPNLVQPWEKPSQFPKRFASALDVMLEGPIGSASFNNEFGRPNTAGYFRTFETLSPDRSFRFGYHKPIMLAGGIGSIREQHIKKRELSDGSLLIVIGGPGMLIGLGGGAASSVGYGQSDEDLDFASVQRSNPEMQRRCQEVINRCAELGDDNPILSIHDVGAGGLCNALPELVHISGLGACIDMGRIPNDDPSMSPMQIWCNEAQERYTVAISPDRLDQFDRICKLESCPYAVVGTATLKPWLSVRHTGKDGVEHSTPVDVEMKFVMGGMLRETRTSSRKIKRVPKVRKPVDLELAECIERTLRFPSVSDKTFLVAIGDRTVSGLVHRDQMVGPWQVPVADSSVTLSGFSGFSGEAMALGERAPIAILDAAASARMAVGEALTNLRSASGHELSSVRLSANWMASAGTPETDTDLYEAVKTVALEICPALGVSIPVGKDSLSMRTKWQDPNGLELQVHAPLSLVVSAFTAVSDVRGSLTPLLAHRPETELLMIDLGQGQCRMGMSAVYQTFNIEHGIAPDMDDPKLLVNFYGAISELMHRNLIHAYHDRSDGGLFATLCEMSFASRKGLDIIVPEDAGVSIVDHLFNEELGAVVQIDSESRQDVLEIFRRHKLHRLVSRVATVEGHNRICIKRNGRVTHDGLRSHMQRAWSELTWRMQSLRDNPGCAQQQYDRILDDRDEGLTFRHQLHDSIAPMIATAVRPKIAILREQGVNGHVEMAAAFDLAGFDSFDVQMSALASGDLDLSKFNAMSICGGFSFGDVFGAGKGWAGSILHNPQLMDMFERFFSDSYKFSFGVCNGCQVMMQLKDIIPGAQHWPSFRRNRSQQFEARLVNVLIPPSKSIMMTALTHAVLPIAVAHGEGRAVFRLVEDHKEISEESKICMRYVDADGSIASDYPANPNGSDFAVAGVTNSDGRITALMPHPERVFRNVQFSWTDEKLSENSPWLELFRSARKWLG